MIWCTFTNWAHFCADILWDHLREAEDAKTECAGRGGDVYRHFNTKICQCHTTATLKEGEELRTKQFSKQARHVCCSFVCSHAVRHTRKLLRTLGETLARNTSWLTCQKICSVACVQTNVGLWLCVYAHEWIYCLSCVCTGFINASVCACMVIVHWAPWLACQDTDFRKLRHSKFDKQTMPGGGSKQWAAALLLSVCTGCHITEVSSTIKAFSMVQQCVCVCVNSDKGSPMTGYIGHAQTKPNTQQEPRAIMGCHSA